MPFFDNQLLAGELEENLLELDWLNDSGGEYLTCSGELNENPQETMAEEKFEFGNPFCVNRLGTNELLELN